jgi:uncharacterized membrane protein YfcA
VLVLIDPAFVPAPITIAALGLNVLLIRRERDGFDPQVRYAMVGLVPGAVVAGVTLASLPEHGLGVLFAVLVMIAVALSAVGLSIRPAPATLLGAGVVSGFMGTISGIGGPPVAIVYQRSPARMLRATLPRFFMLAGAIALGTLVVVGKVGRDELVAAVALLPGALGGYFLSPWLTRHIDRRAARPVVLLLSAIAALTVLAREFL